jgi:hypothetical protein
MPGVTAPSLASTTARIDTSGRTAAMAVVDGPSDVAGIDGASVVVTPTGVRSD